MQLLEDGPADANCTLVLAHGAGRGMDSPFMAALAGGLATRGLRVVRFEFPYMQAARAAARRKPPDREPVLLDCWREVLDLVTGESLERRRLVIAGKSMGGRMASLIADEAGVGGLACLGYPFHPPGKPERLRTAHLETLRTPTIICQGERDPFGSRADVASYTLPSAISLHWLPDGDHGFKPRKRSGHTEAENLASAVTAVSQFADRVVT